MGLWGIQNEHFSLNYTKWIFSVRSYKMNMFLMSIQSVIFLSLKRNEHFSYVHTECWFFYIHTSYSNLDKFYGFFKNRHIWILDSRFGAFLKNRFQFGDSRLVQFFTVFEFPTKCFFLKSLYFDVGGNGVGVIFKKKQKKTIWTLF